AALVAVFRGLIIDRFAVLARLQMQRRATLVAERRTRRIDAVTEETLGREHLQDPDAKPPNMSIALGRLRSSPGARSDCLAYAEARRMQSRAGAICPQEFLKRVAFNSGAVVSSGTSRQIALRAKVRRTRDPLKREFGLPGAC